MKAPSATKPHDQEITCLPTRGDAPDVGCAYHAKAEGASDRDSCGSNWATSTTCRAPIENTQGSCNASCNGRKTVVGTSTLLSVPRTADTEERNANFWTLIAVYWCQWQYLVTSCSSGRSLVCRREPRRRGTEETM